jgi:hypothetical protein
LKEPKTIENLRKKFVDNPELNKELTNILTNELYEYYTYRNNYFKDNFTSNVKLLELKNQKDQNYFSKEKAFNELLYMILFAVKLKDHTELDLTQTQVLFDSINTILSVLKVNDTVTKLVINLCRIGEEGRWSIGRLYNYNPRIVDLELTSIALKDESIRALLIGLGEGQMTVRKLNLCFNSFTSDFGVYFSALLMKMPNLQYLDLSKNPLEKGLNIIIQTIITLTTENKLHLETFIAMSTKIDSYGLGLLGDYVSNQNCVLRSLVLSDNKFNNDGGAKFFKKMINNKSIEELILYKADITNDLAENVFNMLHNNHWLISVSLYDNKIDSPSKFYKLCTIAESAASYATKSERVNIKIISKDYQFANLSNDNKQLPRSELKNTNRLKNYDLSANKCKYLKIDERMFNHIRHVDLEMYDITQNVELKSIDNENIRKRDSVTEKQNVELKSIDNDNIRKFRDLVTEKQILTKIIY